jgi:hypothetical protein
MEAASVNQAQHLAGGYLEDNPYYIIFLLHLEILPHKTTSSPSGHHATSVNLTGGAGSPSSPTVLGGDTTTPP